MGVWLEDIGIGAIVGVAGGLWLLAMLLAIQSSLTRGQKSNGPLIGMLLGFPGFVGGATWLAGTIFAGMFESEAVIGYIYAVLVVVITINGYPCFRLVVAAAERLGTI